MKPRDPALEAARRIAAGEPLDPTPLVHSDPRLARGLARMAAIGRALASDAPVGLTWGHLQRLEPVGAGTFGEVFRAWDPTLDRQVALKLKRRDAPDSIFSGRDFVAEARRLAQVRHPHVLAVHGASYHDDRAGLWADWIAGETLHTRLLRDGPLAADAWLRLATELSAALSAVHAAGIVHGDIKASNVMLDQHGHAVLMDFGAGFASGEDAHLAAGTPHYLAPEATRGDAVDAGIDLYALGVLLHRAACGAYPAMGRVNRRIRPRALRALLADLLDPVAARRPDAGSVQRRLGALRAAPLRRARRWARIMLAAGLVGVAGVSVLGYQRAERQRVRAEAARARAEVTTDVLTDLLGRAAPQALGPKASLRDLLDSAPGMIADRPGLAAGDRAALLARLAQIESGLANDDAAARLAGAAAAAAESVLPDSDHSLALAAHALRLRAVAGQAEAAVSEGEALLARVTTEGRTASLLALVQVCLAEAHYRQGWVRATPQRHARVVALLESALAQPGLLEPADESHALRRLAALRLEADDTAAAVRLGRRAVEVAAMGLGEAHPLTALNRRLLGWTLMKAGRAEEAERLFRANLSRYAGSVGNYSRIALDDRLGLAQAELDLGRTAAAVEAASAAWRDADELYGPAHRTTVDIGLVLANALEQAGRVEAAARTLTAVRTRLADGRGRENRQYLLATRQLGLLHLAHDDDSAASPLLRECAERGRVVLGAEDPVTLECARAWGALDADPP